MPDDASMAAAALRRRQARAAAIADGGGVADDAEDGGGGGGGVDGSMTLVGDEGSSLDPAVESFKALISMQDATIFDLQSEVAAPEAEEAAGSIL